MFPLFKNIWNKKIEKDRNIIKKFGQEYGISRMILAYSYPIGIQSWDVVEQARTSVYVKAMQAW